VNGQDSQRRILIVDDEPTIAELLEPYLEADGFATVCARNADEALAILERGRVDLVVLDLMMPCVSGLDLLRMLRRTSNVPVIIVTARVEEIDHIVGLELGADDYMTKPVRPREAVAHVKAVLRRLENRVLITARGAPTLDVSAEDIVVAGALRLDRRMRSVQLPDRTVVLTRMEFAIVEALATNRGRTLSREQLAGAIDPHGWDGYDRTIDSHVANLRKKIERNPASPELVVTVYGLGYKLNANG
jgi:DNA-binding response OmpR family regulator